MLQRIDLGMHILLFHFLMEPAGTISVEGYWELVDPDGVVLDRQEEPSERDAFRVHVLLGRKVIGSKVSPPESFTLAFDSGHTLRVCDHSPHYESFSIQPGDIYV